MIGIVIGGGGKTIKEIKEKSGAEITIEDDGTVYFTGKGVNQRNWQRKRWRK